MLLTMITLSFLHFIVKLPERFPLHSVSNFSFSLSPSSIHLDSFSSGTAFIVYVLHIRWNFIFKKGNILLYYHPFLPVLTHILLVFVLSKNYLPFICYLHICFHLQLEISSIPCLHSWLIPYNDPQVQSISQTKILNYVKC